MTFVKSRCKAVTAMLLIATAVAIALFALTPGEPTPPPPLASLDASAEKGSYLAKAGNCATCHTIEGGKSHAGGLPFHTPFGVLYSTNITPDKETGIGYWSFEEFHQSMKHGLRPDGSHLYPAFPYTAFARMTDEDIASLYLYLQTLEPVAAPARANELNFPYNLRLLLGPWKTLFHNGETYQPDTAQSAAWNRGAYLVEGPGHCGACHTPRNALGAEQPDMALTGGVYLDKVKFGNYRPWSAVNLTPHDTGLATWSEEDIVAYLKHGLSDRAVMHGPMVEVIQNSTGHLSDEDLKAMAAYLKGIPANAQEPGPAPDKETLAAGEIGYTVHCGSCHLPTGRGDSVLGVSLAGNPLVQATDPSSLINIILYGPHLPPAPFVVDRSRMKMFGKRLSDDDIASIASYVRNAFGNQGSAVTPEQVKKQR